MVMIFAETRRNAAEAAREFHRRFPNARPPSRKYISRLVCRLRMTGSLLPAGRTTGRQKLLEDQKIDILGYFAAYPRASIRAVSAELDVPRSSIWRLLRSSNLHPYSISNHQALLPTDCQRRLDFCNWALIQLESNPGFLRNIIWTDECKFSQDGPINHHNDHYWSDGNQFVIQQRHHQQRFSVNVWCGIFNQKLIGPVMYAQNLTGELYHEIILAGAVTDFIDTVPLAVRQHVWYQQDGAPPHRRQIVTSWLNREFQNQWIGLLGPVAWPPRSPDLSPLDFYLWGRLQDLVYEEGIPRDLPELRSRILQACRTISAAELNNVQNVIATRLQLCIGNDGEHFEQLA